ncbi:MAG: hypothetical protein OIF57_16625 [Marinobacterium sp.]|nr:hypothetical protein [Marinobacterium sp.]
MTNFNPARIHLVDQVDGNVLIRGNTPIGQREGRPLFSFELLVRGINAHLATAPKDIREQSSVLRTLPEQFYLVAFSLVSNGAAEGRYLDLETLFFEKNPGKGKIIHDDLDRLIDLGLIRDDIGKQLDGRVIDRIHQLLVTRLPFPVVVYLHSAAGLDRTGAVIYSYAMKHAEIPFQQAIHLNERYGMRQINNVSLMAVEQYANYIRRFLGVSTVGDVELSEYEDLGELALNQL